jgi:hypothetical protein
LRVRRGLHDRAALVFVHVVQWWKLCEERELQPVLDTECTEVAENAEGDMRRRSCSLQHLQKYFDEEPGEPGECARCRRPSCAHHLNCFGTAVPPKSQRCLALRPRLQPSHSPASPCYPARQLTISHQNRSLEPTRPGLLGLLGGLGVLGVKSSSVSKAVSMPRAAYDARDETSPLSSCILHRAPNEHSPSARSMSTASGARARSGRARRCRSTCDRCSRW